MKKVGLFLGMFLVGTSLSFAGSPEKGNNAAETKVTATYYWITGTTMIGGQPAYTFDEVPQDCDGEGDACKFHTLSGTLTSPQLQSKIEGEDGVRVDTRKN